MNWEGAADQLLAAIDRLFGEAKTRFPAISAHIERAPYAYRFRISASLFYHDKKGDFEDLVISFTCRPLGSSETVKGIPAGASPTGHDILEFEIRRGDSAEIAILDPVVLPQGEDHLEYEEAVLSFIRAAIALLQDRSPEILSLLKEPYNERWLTNLEGNPPSPQRVGWLTSQLRHPATPEWQRERELLLAQGVEPSETILAEGYSGHELEFVLAERGIDPRIVTHRPFPPSISIVIVPPDRVFLLSIDWQPHEDEADRLRSMRVVEWRELIDEDSRSPFQDAIAAGFTFLQGQQETG